MEQSRWSFLGPPERAVPMPSCLFTSFTSCSGCSGELFVLLKKHSEISMEVSTIPSVSTFHPVQVINTLPMGQSALNRGYQAMIRNRTTN